MTALGLFHQLYHFALTISTPSRHSPEKVSNRAIFFCLQTKPETVCTVTSTELKRYQKIGQSLHLYFTVKLCVNNKSHWLSCWAKATHTLFQCLWLSGYDHVSDHVIEGVRVRYKFCSETAHRQPITIATKMRQLPGTRVYVRRARKS